jgi:hypothetical protein
MSCLVRVETVAPRTLAAVRRRIRTAEISAVFGDALGEVWSFLGEQPGLRDDGHNVFVYRPAPGDLVEVDFGVEVTRPFPPRPPVRCVEAPTGRAAVTLHRGGYAKLGAAYDLIDAWCREHGERAGGWSMEIYGDWYEDESRLETTVARALT